MQFIDETITTRNPIFGFPVCISHKILLKANWTRFFQKKIGTYLKLYLKILKNHQVLQKTKKSPGQHTFKNHLGVVTRSTTNLQFIDGNNTLKIECGDIEIWLQHTLYIEWTTATGNAFSKNEKKYSNLNSIFTMKKPFNLLNEKRVIFIYFIEICVLFFILKGENKRCWLVHL